MKKETKEKLIGGFIILMIIGYFVPNEDVAKNVQSKKEIQESVQESVQPAVKNTLKGGYVACISEDLLDQVTTLSVRKDYNGIDYLLKNGCFVTKSGVKFSLLDRSFTGVAKIRVYSGNDTAILWTNNENLNL